MKTIGVIPARYGSTRLKAKVLADINGKPMIQHVYERAKKSRLLDEVLIACDHQEILETAQTFGAPAVLTSVEHPSGSDRVAEAVQKLSVDVVVNIQGDEPLLEPAVIDRLIECFQKNPACQIATPIKKISEPEELENPNIVKVTVASDGCALYFSRSVIPYNRAEWTLKDVSYFKHLGIYAYRKEFLMKFVRLPKSRLESIEGLEQLRMLEAGFKIMTVETDFNSISVDTEADLNRVKGLLKSGARHG